MYWDGELLGSPMLDGTNQVGNVWNPYSYSVTGTGSDVLAFEATGASDGVGGSLDAVSVTSVSAVPEPSTTALMLGGLALIGSLLGRRRSRLP